MLYLIYNTFHIINELQVFQLVYYTLQVWIFVFLSKTVAILNLHNQVSGHFEEKKVNTKHLFVNKNM